MIRVKVIVIGDEILNGQVADTNTGEIARRISAIGGRVVAAEVVGDSPADMEKAVTLALADSGVDVVMTTGGLGPTKDDMTKQVLCRLSGSTLKLDPDALANVERVMAERGLPVNSLTSTQAMLPDHCVAIPNSCGTAPGMLFELNGKLLVAMPGVPFETSAMLSGSVVALLGERFSPDVVYTRRTVLLVGIPESDVAERIASWEDSLPEGFHLAYLPNVGYLRLRLDGCGCEAARLEAEATRLASELRTMLSPWFYHDSDMTPAMILLDELRSRGLTFAAAESCTGGSVSAAMTAVPGSSDVVVGGVVAYSNSVKTGVLGVNPATIDSFGAVSVECVGEMALGVSRLTGASLAVATSGIAGPGGAVPGKPVGTVCSAVALPDGRVVAVSEHFPGGRRRVVERSVNSVLIRAVMLLRESSGASSSGTSANKRDKD